MGSIVKNLEGQSIRGFGGKKYPVPCLIQFVPGYCANVVHSADSYGFEGKETINTIFAVPHVTNKSYKRKSNHVGSEDSRYFPLLRSMGDIPSKGDLVLLCTIGHTNYYLGPLNTIFNNPTWNPDPNFKKEMVMNAFDENIGIDSRSASGESLAFNKENVYSRMQKFRIEDLDYGNNVISETIGDTVFEGRHGNSIRIGSRNNKPYMIFSNEREKDNPIETLGDGTIISITSNGTLQQNFGGYEDVINQRSVSGFQLASDTNNDNSYPIGDIYSYLRGGQNPQDIYDYDRNQILLHSDRITLNSKRDDIFISSIKDVHIGASDYVTISAGKSLDIEVSELNIGNPERAFSTEPMVLGKELDVLLSSILDLIKTITVPTSISPKTPVNTDVVTKADNIKSNIKNMLSNYYNIESNGGID
jgi:hypothetical protein